MSLLQFIENIESIENVTELEVPEVCFNAHCLINNVFIPKKVIKPYISILLICICRVN